MSTRTSAGGGSGRKKPSKTKARAGELDLILGERIRAARQLKGLSQEKLAEHIGVTFQQVQKYEKGVNRVSVMRLLQISQALNQNLGFFIKGLSDGRPSHSVENQVDRAARYRAHLQALEAIPDKQGRDILLKLTRYMGQAA